MRSRQIAERLGVEEAHMLEFQQFNMIWDRKMGEYELHAEELVEAMKERHAAELRDYQRQLMGKQTRPKFSKDLLNLRKIQDTLAKQKEYVCYSLLLLSLTPIMLLLASHSLSCRLHCTNTTFPLTVTFTTFPTSVMPKHTRSN